MPSDISIKSMSVNSGEVTISGVASSKSSLALLVQKLKSVKNVNEVLIGSEAEVVDNEGVKTVTFSMTCTFMLDASLNPTQAAQTPTAPVKSATQAAAATQTPAVTTAATQAATNATAAQSSTQAATR